jgi:hypothetical protein
MENRGAREIDRTVPALMGAPREVDLLEVDKEPFVETAEQIEHASSDQKERANHLIYVTSDATFISREVMRSEKAWHQPVQARRLADKHRERGEAGAGNARCACAVAHAHATDSSIPLSRLVHERQGQCERIRRELRVRIEKEQVFPGKAGRALIARRSKASILFVPYDRRWKVSEIEAVARPVR